MQVALGPRLTLKSVVILDKLNKFAFAGLVSKMQDEAPAPLLTKYVEQELQALNKFDAQEVGAHVM